MTLQIPGVGCGEAMQPGTHLFKQADTQIQTIACVYNGYPSLRRRLIIARAVLNPGSAELCTPLVEWYRIHTGAPDAGSVSTRARARVNKFISIVISHSP